MAKEKHIIDEVEGGRSMGCLGFVIMCLVLVLYVACFVLWVNFWVTWR